MSYNPLEAEYQEICVKIDAINELKRNLLNENIKLQQKSSNYQQEILDEDKWHSEVSIDDLLDDLEKLKASVDSQRSELVAVKQILNDKLLEMTNIKSKIGTLINPLNWLSSKRRYWVKLAEENQKSQRKIESEIAKKEQYIKETKRSFEEAYSSVTRYYNYEDFIQENVNHIDSIKNRIVGNKAHLSKLDNDFSTLMPAFRSVELNRQRVDEEIYPLIEKIEKCYQEIETAKDIVSAAGQLSDLLNTANTPSERRQIHMQCEDRFGHGRPQQVIDGAMKQMESLNRSLIKLDERIKNKARIAALDIRSIVIDGSNLMNSRQKFIGTSLLVPLSQELSKKYIVNIVFDPGAPNILKITSKQLRDMFPTSIKVHISSNRADELILDLANNKTAVVLSSDRFSEYPDKSAVVDCRVFKPEILDKDIYISELNLKLSL